MRQSSSLLCAFFSATCTSAWKPAFGARRFGTAEDSERIVEEAIKDRSDYPGIENAFASLADVESVLPYLESYEPVQVEEKWYDRSTDAI